MTGGIGPERQLFLFVIRKEDDWFAIIRGRVDWESKWEEGEKHGEFVRWKENVLDVKRREWKYGSTRLFKFLFPSYFFSNEKKKRGKIRYKINQNI